MLRPVLGQRIAPAPRRGVWLLAAASLLATLPDTARAQVPPAGDQVPELLRPWKGDLEAMRKRGFVRALVVYSRTFYFVDRGKQGGASYEALRAFEEEINQGLHNPVPRLTIVLVPVSRGEIIPALLEGKGDLAAAGLTITPGREKQVDFSLPLYGGVSEMAVSGPGAPRVSRPAGQCTGARPPGSSSRT